MLSKAQRLTRMMVLALGASALYGVCDLAFSWNPIAAAPYFAHRAEPVFRAVPEYALGVFTEGVNGLLATATFLFVQASLGRHLWRRGLLFGGMVWGFWVVSGTLTTAVWLQVPASVSGMNLAWGLPKCMVIGLGVTLMCRALRLELS